jgi:hypothetical protein
MRVAGHAATESTTECGITGLANCQARTAFAAESAAPGRWPERLPPPKADRIVWIA